MTRIAVGSAIPPDDKNFILGTNHTFAENKDGTYTIPHNNNVLREKVKTFWMANLNENPAVKYTQVKVTKATEFLDELQCGDQRVSFWAPVQKETIKKEDWQTKQYEEIQIESCSERIKFVNDRLRAILKSKAIFDEAKAEMDSLDDYMDSVLAKGRNGDNTTVPKACKSQEAGKGGTKADMASKAKSNDSLVWDYEDEKLAQEMCHQTRVAVDDVDYSKVADSAGMQQQEYDDVVVELALHNYESFYALPSGSATFDKVNESSAGIQGWAAFILDDAHMKPEANHGESKPASSAAGVAGKKRRVSPSHSTPTSSPSRSMDLESIRMALEALDENDRRDLMSEPEFSAKDLGVDERWNPNVLCPQGNGIRAKDCAAARKDEWECSLRVAMESIILDHPTCFGVDLGDNWNPNKVCVKGMQRYSAKDRAIWLIQTEGFSAFAAVECIKFEFPEDFGVHKPDFFALETVCGHQSAWEWGKLKLKLIFGLSASACMHLIILENPRVFADKGFEFPEDWDPCFDCKGKSARERASECVMEQGWTAYHAMSWTMCEYWPLPMKDEEETDERGGCSTQELEEFLPKWSDAAVNENGGKTYQAEMTRQTN